MKLLSKKQMNMVDVHGGSLNGCKIPLTETNSTHEHLYQAPQQFSSTDFLLVSFPPANSRNVVQIEIKSQTITALPFTRCDLAEVNKHASISLSENKNRTYAYIMIE